jgi:hypothetical protein
MVLAREQGELATERAEVRLDRYRRMLSAELKVELIEGKASGNCKYVWSNRSERDAI